MSAVPTSRTSEPAPAELDARRPVVEIRGVSHSFGPSGRSRRVCTDVSFTIRENEFVTLIGPSGCGKTTLLNAVAGLLTPSSGEILVEGRPVQGIEGSRVGYMLATDCLFPWRTALRNVELAMDVGGRKRDRKRAHELLDLVGVGDSWAAYPSQLSHGMRQRVALARTLAVGADMWLMDEPFAALDANTRTRLHAAFLDIWERERKTALLVTHDLMEAIALSDRIIVMSSAPGRIKNIHTVDLPRPRNILELQGSPEFLNLYGLLWNDLREDFAATP